MKNKLFYAALIMGLMAFWSCGAHSTKADDNEVAETVMEPALDTVEESISIEDEGQEMGNRVDVEGLYDFNGDGSMESCYLLEPKMLADEQCEGGCHCLIMFSDDSIPLVEIESCIGGMPEILGDLDGNGTVEIGIWPFWWTSCWQTYYVYTLVNGEWTDFVEPFSVHCNLMEECAETGEPMIEPVKGSKDKFRIRYSEFEMERGIMTKTKIVKKLI